MFNRLYNSHTILSKLNDLPKPSSIPVQFQTLHPYFPLVAQRLDAETWLVPILMLAQLTHKVAQTFFMGVVLLHFSMGPPFKLACFQPAAADSRLLGHVQLISPIQYSKSSSTDSDLAMNSFSIAYYCLKHLCSSTVT